MTELRILKTAVLAPMPHAMISTATRVNPGARRSCRNAYRASCTSRSTGVQPHASCVCSLIRVVLPKRTQCGMARLFWCQAAFTLLFFFKLQIRAQFAFQVLIPFFDVPPSHLRPPRRPATSRAQQLRSSASTGILQQRAASYPSRSSGNT